MTCSNVSILPCARNGSEPDASWRGASTPIVGEGKRGGPPLTFGAGSDRERGP